MASSEGAGRIDRLPNLGKRSLTRVRALLAAIGADAAMLVLSCVALAFLAALLARYCASLDGGAEHLDVGSRAPGCHSARRRADIGAVEI